MTETLRGYQVDVIADVECEIAAGNRRILLVAPTGSGKTIVAGEIIQHYVRRYRPVLVLAHRLEIITQTSGKLHARGIAHGIIKAGFRAATDGAGAARLGADPVGARHALGGDAAAARRSGDHR